MSQPEQHRDSDAIAGKGIQGGVPADLDFIRFNFTTNQWEFVPAGAGEINTGANVGAGVGLLFRDKVGVVLNFKSLLQGTNITLTNNANDVTIDGPVPGETNLIANVGGGAGLVFRDKIGVTFNLKSILAGAGITVVNNADDITISAPTANAIGIVGSSILTVTAAATAFLLYSLNTATGSLGEFPILRTGTMEKLTVNVRSNGILAATVITLQIGGVDTLLTVSVPASTTGIFTIESSVVVTAGDLVRLEVVGGAGGTNMTLNWMVEIQ